MRDSITTRIDTVTHIPETHLTVTPPVPRSVKIELSGRCNYRCGFCALSTRTAQPTADMDFALFQRITAEMSVLGVQEIGVFFIGESFLAPRLLVDAIRYLKDTLRMPYVFLTSNASAANPQTIEQCMSAGLDSLKWSCNAADAAQFSEVMSASDRLFYRAQSNIQSAWAIRQAKGYATKLYASSIRYDGAQHERMQGMLSACVIPYVDQHYWLPLYSMGDLATKRENTLGYLPIAGNPGRYDNPVDPLPCWSAFSGGHVLADGRMSACCFDATGNWVMGDLTTQTFLEAWHSAAFQTLRDAHLRKDVRGTACEACAMRPR